MSIVELVTVCASIAAIVISLATAIFVYLQVHFMRRQMYNDALARIIQNNKEVVSLGIQDEGIWKIMEGERLDSKMKEKRYAQLWINQIMLAYNSWRNGFIDEDVWRDMRKDIKQAMQQPALREKWENSSIKGENKFEKFINDILKEKD